MRSKIVAIIAVLLSTLALSAQDATLERIEREKEQVQRETELLLKQKAYLDALRGSIPQSNLPGPSGRVTVTNNNPAPDTETAALSYEALQELSARVSTNLRPILAQYRNIVIYNEPDFLALAKYRLYRHRTRTAIQNYELIVSEFRRRSRASNAPDVFSTKELVLESVSVGSRAGGSLLTALSAPALGTSYAKSIGELLSVFRTDTTITPSYVNIENTSLGSAISSVLIKEHPHLTVYYPQKFVPEFDLDTDVEGSLLQEMAQIEVAYGNTERFLARSKRLTDDEKNNPALKDILIGLDLVGAQLRPLVLIAGGPADVAAPRPAGAQGGPNINQSEGSEIRQLLRAEKLDRILRGASSSGVSNGPSDARTGIIQVKVLASGGSRRESRNLFLGSKVDYSGAAVIEVVLFDPSGAVRSSEIFTYHTGFRKIKAKAP